MQAILDAALDVFSQKGFSQARLDDVARKAGVAKGTLYLYVSSKQGLFEALVRSGIGGPVREIEQRVLAADLPTEALLRMLFAFFASEVLGTRRKDIIKLILTEAPRFPEIAAFYYQEVISRGLGILRHIGQRAVARGEIQSDEIVRFPQLVIAPALVAVLWKSLFEKFQPLDVEEMFAAHVSLLMRGMKGREP